MSFNDEGRLNTTCFALSGLDDHDNIGMVSETEDAELTALLQHLERMEPLYDDRLDLEDPALSGRYDHETVTEVSPEQDLSIEERLSSDVVGTDPDKEEYHVPSIIDKDRDTSDDRHLSLAAMFRVVVLRQRPEVNIQSLAVLADKAGNTGSVWQVLLAHNPRLNTEVQTQGGIYCRASATMVVDNHPAIGKVMSVGAIHYSTNTDKEQIYFLPLRNNVI